MGPCPAPLSRDHTNSLLPKSHLFRPFQIEREREITNNHRTHLFTVQSAPRFPDRQIHGKIFYYSQTASRQATDGTFNRLGCISLGVVYKPVPSLYCFSVSPLEIRSRVCYNKV